MPKENRVSKITFENRVFKVQERLIDAVPDYLIIKQIKDDWNLSDKQAGRYLSLAYSRWRPKLEIEIDEKRQARIAWMKNEIRTMDEKYKNTPIGKKVTLQYIKELNKLDALYPSKRLQIEGSAENPLNISTQIQAIEIVRATDENKD